MQSPEDVAKAEEGERAFHAKLSAARHEMETNPNPWERQRAAALIGRMTCHDVNAPSHPDDRLWFGSRWLYRYERERDTPELDRYFSRCRRLWQEHVVSARRLGSSRNTKIGPKKARRAKN